MYPYTTASQVYELAEKEFSTRYAKGYVFDESNIEHFLRVAFKQHIFEPKLEEDRGKLWRRVWKRLYWKHPEWKSIKPTHHMFTCDILPNPYEVWDEHC